MKRVIFFAFIMIFLTGSILSAEENGSLESYQANKIYRYDLDGDGKLDIINYSNDGENSPVIYINQEMYTLDQVSPELFLESFKIVDIDKSDNYKEIAIAYTAPPNKNVITFYRYTSSEVEYIGDIPGKPENIGKNIDISGDGNIIITINSEFVQGATYQIYYGILNNELVQTSRDDIYYYQKRIQKSINGKLNFYKSINSSEFVTFDSDVTATFLGEVDGWVWVQIKGDVYWLKGDEKSISFSRYNLDTERKKWLIGHGDISYTSFPDSDGNTILAIYAPAKMSGGCRIHVKRIVEVDGRLEVYVYETFPGAGDTVSYGSDIPETIVKLDSSNDNIIIKDENGNDYNYFMPTIDTYKTYFIESAAYEGLFWDLFGFNFDAERKGGKIKLYEDDNGADRFIKLIPVQNNSGSYWLQPQHSDYVAAFSDGSTTPGSELILDKLDGADKTQTFKFIEVEGQTDTYYIQNEKSGLYLTGHGRSQSITQEEYKGNDEQQWIMLKKNVKSMAAPSTGYVYSLENVMAEKFIDVPGAAPDQGRKDAELQLWDMDYQPDRYVELNSTDSKDYFYVNPLHSTLVWDVEGANKVNGTDVQLYNKNNQSNQQFKFKYAGEPLTYYIIDRYSGKLLTASKDKINENGCPVEISALSGISKEAGKDSNQDNQKWRLHAYQKWQLPPEDQDFYIKTAYMDHYLSVEGSRHEGDFNGRYLEMQDRNNIGNVRVKILPSGDARWVNIEVQIRTGLYAGIENNSKSPGVALKTLPYKKGSNGQKFAIQFTSPTTFVLRTNNWFTIDIGGEGDELAKVSGTTLLQYLTHYGISQQFQLVYASGPNEGEVYQFPSINGD